MVLAGAVAGRRVADEQFGGEDKAEFGSDGRYSWQEPIPDILAFKIEPPARSSHNKRTTDDFPGNHVRSWIGGLTPSRSPNFCGLK